MFSPKWKKEAKHLVKGALKFLHYKRDLLDEGRIGEIESRRQDLIDAIKQSDKDAVAEASKQLRATCENSLPREKPLNWFEENVEVMFVAIVIALGLRAYYLQPFRIPTGSMQPTLNGITGAPLARDQWPSLPQRLTQKILRGRTYVELVAKEDMQVPVLRTIDPDQPYVTDLSDFQYMHFFSRSLLQTIGSDTIRLPAPASPMYAAGLSRSLERLAQSQGIHQGAVHVPKGTKLCVGYIDTGDLVLVNKFAYHFRKPKRGEVFVFDTLGIRGIHERSHEEQGGGSHYIKRLCGVPGDSLSIKDGDLYNHDKLLQEEGIVRVMEGKGGKLGFSEKHKGYVLAGSEVARPGRPKPYQSLGMPGQTLKLQDQTAPGMREYAALGDNTGNSQDSRYWGSVKEYNLVGPALFSLWPISTGHWGFIK